MKHLLIDHENLLRRAFHASSTKLPDGTLLVDRNEAGEPINAIRSYIASLSNRISEIDPARVTLVLDRGCKYRKTLLSSYKEQRKPKPEELIFQQKKLEQILSKTGLRIAFVPDEEADDAIASIVTQNQEDEFLILTSDLDMAQLIDKKNHLIRPNKTTGWEEIKGSTWLDIYGYPPKYRPLFSALKGEIGDNIGGIPGYGDKRASELCLLGSKELISEALDDKNPHKGFSELFKFNLKLTTLRNDFKIHYLPELVHTQLANEITENLSNNSNSVIDQIGCKNTARHIRNLQKKTLFDLT